MPDYGQTEDKIQIIRTGNSASISLISSGSLLNHTTAISASVPSIIAVTCSANVNNRLTSPVNPNAYGIITVSSGSNVIKPIRLVLTYVSSSFTADFTGSILSTEETIFDKNNISYTSSNYTRDHIVSIPILNNDDSFIIAAKTVKSIKKVGGFGTVFSASLVDDGSGIANLTGSIGSMAIGTTLKLRNSSSADGSEGRFLIHSLKSGSIAEPDFAGTAAQLGGMEIGSSFKIGGADPVFTFSIVQSGSGQSNQSFYPGNLYPNSSSLIIKTDPNDKTSTFISGSGGSLLYFSSSGNIGIGTNDPQSTLDIGDTVRIQGALTASTDLLVGGTLTAREFHTEFVSSSILHESGSTVFGNSVDDTHVFTGNITTSADISGSITSTGSFGQVDAANKLFINGVNSEVNLNVIGLVTGHGHADSNNRFTLGSGTELHFFDSNASIKRDGSTFQISSAQGHKFLIGTANYGVSIGTNTVTGYGLRVQKSGSSGTAIISDDAENNPWEFNPGGNNIFSGSLISTGSFGRVEISGDISASGTVEGLNGKFFGGNLETKNLLVQDQYGSSNNFARIFNGNITASGNISASGEIIGIINGGSF